jgi:hypothetical protein
MSVLQDKRLKVHKGEKGRLINFHDQPRQVNEVDHMRSFEICMGSQEKAQSTIELFTKLNNGDKNQKIMADGLISTLITTNNVTNRTLAFVFKIGTGRIKRNRDKRSKLSEYEHLNGSQVSLTYISELLERNFFSNFCYSCMQITDEDLDVLNQFVNSLTVENGYPCSHRRMKKYISEVGIDNFTR